MAEDAYNSSIIDVVLDKWRRRKWLVIVCFLAVFSVVGSLVMALPALYRSSTTILFGQDSISESLVRTNAPNDLGMRLGAVRQAVMSRTQLQEIINAFDLYPQLRVQASPEAVINRLRKDIDIEQRTSVQPEWGQNSTYAITISYQGWNPEQVAQVANNLADRYQAENERIRTDQAVRTTAFISEQLDAAKQKFAEQENRINAFKNEHMGELPEQQAINMATLERLNVELRLNGEKQVQLLNRRDDLLFGGNGGGKDNGAVGLTGRLRLDRLKLDLTELQLRYTENYPGIIRLKKEIAELTHELAGQVDVVADDDTRQLRQNPAEIDRELTGLRGEEKKLRAGIVSLMRKIEDTPRIEQQLKRFAYGYDTAREEYLSLQKLYQDAYLAESLEKQQNQQFKVIETAIPSDFPAAPNRFKLIFIGFILALGFAAGAALLAEYLDKSFHSIFDIRQFTNIPVLANIHKIQTAGDKWRSTARFILVSVMVVAGLFVMVNFSHYAGKNGEQLVWAISG